MNSGVDPLRALEIWAELFVDLALGRRGLAAAIQSDDARFAALRACFVARLVFTCALPLDAVRAAHASSPQIGAYELLPGSGTCAWAMTTATTPGTSWP